MLGRCPESEGPPWVEDHGASRRRPPAWLRRWAARLAWVLWALVVLGLARDALAGPARPPGRPDRPGVECHHGGLRAGGVSAATVGTLLGGRRPRHPVGWPLLALGLWFVYGYASWVLLAWRGAPPAVGLALLDANVMVIPALIGFVLLLTPTGSLPSPGWRWWARVAATVPLLGLVSLGLSPFREVDPAVANPLAVDALVVRCWWCARPPLWSLGLRSRWAPGRWSCVTVAPVGWSASSCAG
jgi:hypothetical protein